MIAGRIKPIKQIRLGRTRFPALGAVNVYSLRVLIGSLRNLAHCDWPGVIALVSTTFALLLSVIQSEQQPS